MSAHLHAAMLNWTSLRKVMQVEIRKKKTRRHARISP
jgi:hypothetical protein